ncbi:hypothetical protein GCM10029992_63550 [Glycomyces albus]
MASQAGDCGCADWRTDTDLDTDFQDDLSNVFPIGLYPDEWAPALNDDLNRVAEQAETDAAWAAAKTARAKARARFTTETTTTTDKNTTKRTPVLAPEAEPTSDIRPTWAATDPGPPPYLPRPPREAPAAGRAHHTPRSPNPSKGSGPSPCPAPADHPEPLLCSLRRRPIEPRPNPTRRPHTGPADHSPLRHR